MQSEPLESGLWQKLNNNFRSWAYLFFLGFGLLMLYLAFKDADLNAILESIRQADYRWVSLSLFATLVCHLIRAWRWQLLLEPLDIRPGFLYTYLSMMSGYFVNTAIPRVGEITRCALITRKTGKPFSSALGTVVIERLADLVMLFLVIVITLIWQYELLSGFFMDQLFSPLWQKIVSLIDRVPFSVMILAAAALVFLVLRRIMKKKGTIEEKKEELGKLEQMAEQLELGLKSVLNLRHPFLFVFQSVLIWILYFFMTYLCFFAMEPTTGLSIAAGVALVGIGSLGRSVPVQAGGMGAYHWILTQGLILYGIAKEDGLALATLIHAAQTLFYLILGGLSLLVVTVFYKEGKKSPHPA